MKLLIRILIFQGIVSMAYGKELQVSIPNDAEPSEAFLKCINLYKEKKAPAALACFAALIKMPDTSIAEKVLGYRALSAISIEADGDTLFAKDMLLHAIDEIKNSPDLFFTLCDVLYRRAQYSSAINYCSKGWSIMDQSKPAHNDLHLRSYAVVGDSYFKMGDYENAEIAYRVLLDSKLNEYRDMGKKRIDNLSTIKNQTK